MNMSMKKMIIHLYTLSFKLFLFFKYQKQIDIRHSLFWNCKMVIAKTNSLNACNGYLSKSELKVYGKNNRIKYGGGEIFNSQILIEGDDNLLILENGTKMYNTNLKIIADRCIVRIGENSTIGSSVIVCMGNRNSISIGKNCMLADNVEIWNTDSHPIFVTDNRTILNSSKPITIGDHVWIGKSVTILKGVTIGDGAVIGMRSLVTKDIPSGTLNVGSPAKVVKEGICWDRNYIKE